MMAAGDDGQDVGERRDNAIKLLRILMHGAALLEPDGTQVLRHGLMGSPYDLRQIARRYRPGADPFGSIPPRQWASANITS
jgi:hypothetical protein